MTGKEMWDLYINKNPRYKNAYYESWSFGYNAKLADELAKLVIMGTKTATASAYELYEIEKSPLPPVGGFNIILDANQNAVCITQTTNVSICRFKDVSADHAYKEGEGNRSLDYWRKVHKRAFETEFKSLNIEVTDETLVVCEEFKVVFK